MGNIVVKEEPQTYFESLILVQIFIGVSLLIAIFALFPKRREDAIAYNTPNYNSNYRNRKFDVGNVNYEDNTTQHIEQTQLQRRVTETAVTPGNVSFLYNNIWNEAELLNWEYYNYNIQPVHFVTLHQNSSEYQYVRQLFLEGTTKFQIYKIERIQNVYLLAAFLLKREEMERRYPSTPPVVEELFHGTKKQNVMSICTDNFNWRLFGKNEGNKFGQGVSFTPISHYATYYGDEDSELKVMFLANVLIGNECVGTRYTKLPPAGYDTTAKENGHVIVKYEDNEFYPAYKITYYCKSQKEQEQRKIKKYQKKRRHTPKTNYEGYYQYDVGHSY